MNHNNILEIRYISESKPERPWGIEEALIKSASWSKEYSPNLYAKGEKLLVKITLSTNWI